MNRRQAKSWLRTYMSPSVPRSARSSPSTTQRRPHTHSDWDNDGRESPLLRSVLRPGEVSPSVVRQDGLQDNGRRVKVVVSESGTVEPAAAAAANRESSSTPAMGIGRITTSELSEAIRVVRGRAAEEPPGPATRRDDSGYGAFWSNEVRGLKGIMFKEIHVLLVVVPLGYLAYWLGWGAKWVFLLNFIALVPLAALLGFVTEELAEHTGEIIGGLLNATFGNAVELILTIQSLRKGLLTVVKGTLLGSILSNLLLVLGMSFFAAGVFYKESEFNVQGASSNTTLLLLSSLGLAVPMVFHLQEGVHSEAVLEVSRISACVLFTVYIMFLLFQLVTHIHLFQNEEEEEDKTATLSTDHTMTEPVVDEGLPIDEMPHVSLWTSIVMLLLVTIFVSISSEYLVGSIEAVTKAWDVPQMFIGVVLLPIAGNAAEHWTAVSVAVRNKLDLTIGVAAGSSTQIALFVVPFAVLMGWALGQPMSMDFKPLETTILFIAVLIVMAVVADGRSNWLEGMMLMAAYLLVAIVLWFSPINGDDGLLEMAFD
ncbi:unnamed protein product [Vitrella brassicaformis CCMP3155]|uniref:Sodium/calcium exchanger membrane region domain-containing protein n=2 Tax=Vitrella brassicaformis TaxID=1169539 RepID=A0A0G4FHK5_VITBC|nr:unnamed protein product [Vitrella brassicaformis CCMP3155]|eukprot:CEM12943.1 unnamed protein product [Vitrella brassicaformis CCMP3155]